ncbi:hypothetical protein SAMN02745244_00553 [Tessaracoccus bendigoensis DSM 12906]|uniref:CAAX prenyl protease 2/Lysostaphin resistance protein A-like domain-containing protein n=1 Tax=Tessaracoccus bendigoensis DSM 12906 TaxID=1123357 RepID=A0A1M6BYK4_9ACTN|nr:CPBP family intramembrane glutamic endopeptidase [Tessaracoccus bendigoensis]SHI53787.1 hypothetical protein SAMN02745244_00553 [Tessaracoccus bendigoensis DSM 12906]
MTQDRPELIPPSEAADPGSAPETGSGEAQRGQWAPPSIPVPQHRAPGAGTPGWDQSAPWAPPTYPPPDANIRRSPLPGEPTSYPQFWRPATRGLPIAASLLMGAIFLVVTTVVVAVAILASGTDDLTAIVAGEFTPGVVLANSVAIALVLPFSFLVARITGQRPGYLSSVVGRFRWGFFWKCVAVAAAVLLVYMGVPILFTGVGDLGLAVRDYSWWLLIGLLLVTPFQAAAEEYLLRGFVYRTVGSWFAAPMVAAVVGGLVNSLIFAAIHLSTDPWLNLTYFSIGAIASYLVWRTGGLEAAVALHIVNNMIGMGLLPFQDLATQFDRSAGAAGAEVLLQLLAFAVSAWLIVLVAKRSRVARLGPERPTVNPEMV